MPSALTYTFHRRFISALREPLRQEVLKQGLNPEKSTISQLYELANAIEEATRYNQGTRRTEGISIIPSTTQRPIVSKPKALNHSVCKSTPVIRPAPQSNPHSHSVNVIWHEQRTAPTVPMNKNTPTWSGNMSRPCYTLSRSRDSPSSVAVLWAVGLQRVHSSILSVIMIILFNHPSPNSVPPTFHVSDLRFISCFRSYSHFCFVLFSIPEPETRPWHMPDSRYPDMFP